MNGKVNYAYILFSVCLLSIYQVSAQEGRNLYSDGFTFGLNSDAFTAMEFGYIRNSRTPAVPFSYYARLNIPLLLSVKQNKLDTWELKAGISAELLRQNKFILITDFSLFSIKHKQILGTFFPIGLSIKLSPGLQTKNGYIALQTRFKQVLATHINHSEYVKNSFDEIYDSSGNLIKMNPRNGLYAFTGHHLYYGLEGMFRVSKKINMYYDLGIKNYLSKYTNSIDAMMFGQVPFFTNIQLNYKINQ